jgi:hypothetical protein
MKSFDERWRLQFGGSVGNDLVVEIFDISASFQRPHDPGNTKLNPSIDDIRDDIRDDILVDVWLGELSGLLIVRTLRNKKHLELLKSRADLQHAQKCGSGSSHWWLSGRPILPMDTATNLENIPHHPSDKYRDPGVQCVLLLPIASAQQRRAFTLAWPSS